MNKHEVIFEIYSKDEYDRIFTAIKKISSNKSAEEISSEIHKRFNLTILVVQDVDKPDLDNLELYRLRIPKPGEKFEENVVLSYSYPPDEFKEFIPIGRANLKGQQVFYASADCKTPFLELESSLKQGSNIVYLSTWKIKNYCKPVMVRNLFLGIPEENENNSSFMARGLKRFLETILSKLSEADRENYIYSQTRYTELFTIDSKEFYHLSSAIANHTFIDTFKQKANIPILTYPSIVNKADANFAIRKDFADEHLYIKKIFKILVEIEDKKAKTSVINEAIIEGDKIKWP